SPSTSPSASSSNNNNNHDSQEMNQTSTSYGEDNGVSSELKKMTLDNISETTTTTTTTTTTILMDTIDDNNKSKLEMNFISVAKGVCCIAQNFEDFTPLIKSFLSLGKEIILLYEKAEHHKELCSYLLQRCNCAMAAVQDL